MSNSQHAQTPPTCHFYLVLDLEATCCDQGTIPREETEIIEIGAVMVQASTLQLVDEFCTFVRPVLHPRLTAFCTEMTSIAQQQVDSAPLLAEALLHIRRWAEQYPRYLFCSWGDYDRNQIEHECQRAGIPYPFAGDHLNLKVLFSQQQGLQKRFGMAGALRKVGLPLEGTHHRGIDDARNIARLLPYVVGTSQVGGQGRRQEK
jgi:inhibitor of KinA sporulation pathway (predicted exonuclease)